ncbi:hypothetical protein [Prevotella sp. HUN102]|uniref:hypothetical protein n=1 Tax=Prevotella sp. HUN102 TaxID=1392486 RepID=UPI00049086C1|nr:hypothetical protein [Prevotella sp. HUN102]
MREIIHLIIFSLGLLFTLYNLLYANGKIKDKTLQKVTNDRDILLAALFAYLILMSLDVL